MTDSILVVEDEQDIADLISVNLREISLNVEHSLTGEKALELAFSKNYALILLDVMLPGISGLDVCRKIRDKKPAQAILMLTSRTSETDRVVGLELGADDYMTKPFSVRELQARVRSQLRRVHLISTMAADAAKLSTNIESIGKNSTNENSAVGHDQILCVGSLQINIITHIVTLKNKQLELTSTEFDLLFYMASHPEQVFSRTQLLSAVWGYHHSGYEHTVNSHINRLRNKLEHDPTNPKIVQTVWGVGYKFTRQGVC